MLSSVENDHVIGFNTNRFPQQQFSKILCRWSAPRAGFVAVNCDASYRPLSGNGGYGIVIRDHAGRVEMTKASHFPMIDASTIKMEYGVRVLMLELIAIRDGLRLSKNLGFTSVDVRSDSQTAISILIQYVPCPDECLEIVHEIMSELQFFHVLSVTFVYRECNRAADFLSRFLTRDGEKCIDSSEIPQDLQRIVFEDSIGLLIERPSK